MKASRQGISLLSGVSEQELLAEDREVVGGQN